MEIFQHLLMNCSGRSFTDGAIHCGRSFTEGVTVIEVAAI